MTMTRAQFANNFDENCRKIIMKKASEHPPEFPQIFWVGKSERKQEIRANLAMPGGMAEKSEGASVSYADATEGFKTTLTNRTFGLGVKITMEMQQDDRFDLIKKFPVALEEAARNRMEIDAANILNRAFSGSYVGADAVCLCSTLHPYIKGGGTYRNRPSTDAELGYTSLQQALVDFDNFADDNGYPRLLQAKKLIVPTALRSKAEELLAPGKIPYFLENTISTVNNKGLVPVVNHYMTSNSWFLAPESNEDGLVFFKRMEPNLLTFLDEHSRDIISNLVMRHSCGWFEPWYIWGSYVA